MNIRFHRWGIILWALSIIWYDLFDRVYGIEITWNNKEILLFGFKGGRK